MKAVNTYQFVYDALGHRISETDNGTLTKQWVWAGGQMVEERNSSNTVTKRFYAQGEQIGGTNYYYTRDHLGSVREITNSSGAIVARYDYDPYGRVTPVGTITVPSDFQYAGMYEHATSGLSLTKYRAYDPNTAKWLSRDPLGEGGDTTLYSYVLNDPINLIDPWGLRAWSAAETQAIIDQEANQLNSENFFQKLKTLYADHNRYGKNDFKAQARDHGTPSDIYDYKDTFYVNGQCLNSSQFGNYLAGYESYTALGAAGISVTSAFGVGFAIDDGSLGTFDPNDGSFTLPNPSGFDQTYIWQGAGDAGLTQAQEDAQWVNDY